MVLEENTMFFRSPRGAASGQRAEAFFSTDRDSPVRADSSAFRLTASRSRASAGTKSPASSRRMSPGTRSSEAISAGLELRMTLAWGADSFFRAAMAFSALLSWTTPVMALMITINKMIMESM